MPTNHNANYLYTHRQAVPYSDNLTSVFATICDGKDNTLLLESAEIDSRNSLNSLLFINTAIKIECVGQQVNFYALTENGKALLPLIQQAFAQEISDFSQDDCLTLTFTKLDSNLDEDSKLQTLTVFDGLRVIQKLFADNSQDKVYLGGLFSYDLVANFIPMDGIELHDDGLSSPDYCFYLAEQLLLANHQQQTTELHSFCFSPSTQAQVLADADKIIEKLNQPLITPSIQSANTEVSISHDDKTFKEIIEKLKVHIYQGDVFQIVPSRRFSLACPSPLSAYYQLKQSNPSPYMFYMQDKAFTLFGASPESSLKYTQASRQLEVYPIAGSRPRGFDEHGNIDNELDARMELDLRLDKKELAEHLMLVDLARNDIARVCETGSRTVDKLMQVDRYSHIMHLVSRVVGRLKPSLDALHAYQACMNMGTLTGAPKIRAMQLIYQQEQQKRHSYGGAVGYLTSCGDFDTCIVIRSAFVQNGVAHVQAGCGEVLDSDPQAEADETRHKARAVIKAISEVHG
ncbi:MAG: anthranilate synthase component 1 [Moraxellaceae bacterium]|nr:anthranilate synthase component 1 [Moraxellaceae bacterium]